MMVQLFYAGQRHKVLDVNDRVPVRGDGLVDDDRYEVTWVEYVVNESVWHVYAQARNF